MAENVVYVRGTRASVHRAIARAAQAASGSGGSPGGAAEQLQVRIGLATLGNIRRAFVVKAKGGTDECGLSWPPLAKSTVAYSRRHPGVPKSKQRAGFSPSWMLTEKQRKRWWTLYRSFLGKAPAGAAFHATGAQKGSGWAAARAWMVLKSEGARTLMMEYGDMKVEILRDTGLLLNSLSPGVEPTVSSVPTSPLTPEHQVFQVSSGSVIVGTNRKHAGTHHNGTDKIPQRRLWPEPSQWTDIWWEDIQDQAKQGYIDIVIYYLRNP